MRELQVLDDDDGLDDVALAVDHVGGEGERDGIRDVHVEHLCDTRPIANRANAPHDAIALASHSCVA